MSGATLGLADGRTLSLDERGYLLEPSEWSPVVAEAMATADQFELTDAHWQVLDEVRTYFSEHGIEPPVRALIMRLRRHPGNERMASRELYALFPEGPARQAVRYAGLPRPISCI